MAESIFSKVDFSEDTDLKGRLWDKIASMEREKKVVSFESGRRKPFEVSMDDLAGVSAAQGIGVKKPVAKKPTS